MDRRRRAPAAGATSKPTPPRILRRPLALLRRAISSRDAAYAAVSLALLLLTAGLIALLTVRSSAPVAYPPLRASTHVRASAAGAPGLAVAGSVRELDGLLSRVTNGSAAGDRPARGGRLVVAIAVNYAFRRLALNFVCNLKRLGVANYVVLAMDRAVFDYLSTRKANVFFYTLGSRRRLLGDGDTFGSAAFVETSRRKSLLVLKVLRLGYSVVFSDVDVVWVRNPIPELLRHDFDFVMQSDRAHADRDTALNYNINSGFYLVRSSLRSVTALQAIVKYAAAIRRSEQKAFNYVLCGAFKDHHAGPGLRVGASECTYRKGGATARVLSLEAFPNGSDVSLWSNSSSSFAESHPDVVAVHANYVEGRVEKVERIKKIGFWWHSEESERVDECVFGVKT